MLGTHSIGWIGTGRMGFPMAARLAKAGANLAAWNRTRAKAEPLGVRLVDRPVELAACDMVFIMVSADPDLQAVTQGPDGLLTGTRAPQLVIECSTVSQEASAALRAAAKQKGAEMLAAPVSGNGKVVKAGRLSVVASGPKPAFDLAKPYLDALGTGGASYVGEGELARVVKICHNMLLGVVIQSLAEITVLAQKAGVPRHAFLSFINNSVMGSTFSRYKTPALVNLDFQPTHTSKALRKDLDLALAAAREQGVPMPVAAATREALQSLIGQGYGDVDFAALIEQTAKQSGLAIVPENVAVSDGLS